MLIGNENEGKRGVRTVLMNEAVANDNTVSGLKARGASPRWFSDLPAFRRRKPRQSNSTSNISTERLLFLVSGIGNNNNDDDTNNSIYIVHSMC